MTGQVPAHGMVASFNWPREESWMERSKRTRSNHSAEGHAAAPDNSRPDPATRVKSNQPQ